MDVLDHLTQEHRKAESLMASLAETDPGAERDRLIAELEDALTTHMAVEEQFLYPIVEDAIGAEDVEEAHTEHQLARDGLAALRETAGLPGFGAALDMLEAGIAHHVSEEEKDMFPELRKKAADAIEALDPEVLEAAAGATRQELYDAAREADIAGRSQMSKTELSDALIARD